MYFVGAKVTARGVNVIIFRKVSTSYADYSRFDPQCGHVVFLHIFRSVFTLLKANCLGGKLK